MKIVVNTRFLIKDKLEGIGWFTYETMKRISMNHPEHEFYFLFDRKFDKEFIFSKNITPIIISPPARHTILWRIWFHYQLPRTLKKLNADVFVSTDGYMPLKCTTPSLNVIHDINFEHRPDDLKPNVSKYYTKYFPQYARVATRLATVSKFSKQDIVKAYNIDPSKIDVVYNGANTAYVPLDDAQKKAVKEKYTKGKEYFIFIGSLHPRKNICSLLQAFDNFKAADTTGMQLVIVGQAMFMNEEMKAVYGTMTFKEDVLFTGRIPTADLHLILGAAFAMTFVPHFEGFGIPILEALYCDIPVISSNVTSMPEVGGDAALYVNPNNVGSITNAMLEIVSNPKLRQEMIEKGRIQREKFSWDKTANLLWNSINQLI